MKITFEGKNIGELLDQMQETLREFQIPAAAPAPVAAAPARETFISPVVDNPVANPVEKPEVKPGKVRSPKQLENDERLRQRAVEKAAAKKAAAPPAEKAEAPAEEPAPIDPADMVKLRTKTIAELQEAYANGQQKEVFELLSKYGKGAKSFRELPAEAFAPIREAIDAGALS